MKAPRPWKFVKGNSIEDATGRVIMCDMQYYPWIDLDDEDWQAIVDAINMEDGTA